MPAANVQGSKSDSSNTSSSINGKKPLQMCKAVKKVVVVVIRVVVSLSLSLSLSSFPLSDSLTGPQDENHDGKELLLLSYINSALSQYIQSRSRKNNLW